ncbi:MAG TPA: S8 family peptidase [Candidatus Acidoferrales bacterium]|jgi:serine protease AprX|nr:S8 family peptidase [Candidatus Acidoferrales bacterium]
MKFVNTKGLSRCGSGIHKYVSARLIMTLALLLFAISTLHAAPAHPSHKIAADLASYPVNPDGTVDVIIQFTEKPQARHFEMMASHGARLKFALEHINGAAYRIPVKLLQFLENHPDVAYVSPDRVNKAAWDDEIPAVMDNVVRQQYTLDGSGIGIAVIDSGVYNHDDLQNASGTASRIVYSESFVPGDSATTDLYGHGTHVAGILAGNGRDSATGYAQQYVGLAPKANIINLRVLDKNGAGSDSAVIAAIQRAIDLKNTYNIRIINLSLGRPVYESAGQDPLCQAVEAAWKAGIVVVVAAGNSGRDNSGGTDGYATIQSPGNDPLVITVGATKTNGTATRLDDYVASYSSKGPTLLDHVVKPDLVAPGNRIVSLVSPSSYLAQNYQDLEVNPLTVCVTVLGINTCSTGPSNKYMRLSGTSMATPVVAGAAALMLQKDPTLTPDSIKARMMKTAWKGYPQASWGYDSWGRGYLSQYDVFTIGAGYLDVYAALQSSDVASGSTASPTAVYNSSTGQASLSMSGPVSYGSSITWGSSIIWGNSIVWGTTAVLNDSIIWGNSIIWGQSGVSGNTIIWGSCVNQNQTTVSALSDGEDGEN